LGILLTWKRIWEGASGRGRVATKPIADKLRNLQRCQEGFRLFLRNLSHEQITLS
jgi:hypothetical protein